MRAPLLVCCIAAFLTAPAAWAGKEDAAARGLAAADGECFTAQLRASGSGWVGICAAKETTRLYFVRVAGNKAHVTKLFERGQLDYDVRPNGVNITYTDGGQRHSLGFFLEGDKPELPDEHWGGEPLCPPERYRDHYNKFAAGLHGPTTTIDYQRHRVMVERQLLECHDGIHRFTTRGGLSIPSSGLAIKVDAALVPANGSNPANVWFAVAAQSNAEKKSTRFLLSAADSSANPPSGTDAKSGDHFEIWLAPPGRALTCDEAFKVEPTCTAPVAAAPVKLSVARGSDGKLITSVEPAGGAKEISASLADRAIAIDVPEAQVVSGLAILYLDAATHVTVGTGRPEKSEFSTVSGLMEIHPPALEEKIVPLK